MALSHNKVWSERVLNPVNHITLEKHAKPDNIGFPDNFKLVILAIGGGSN